MMKKYKKILIGSISIILFILAASVTYMSIGHSVNTNALIINNISLNNETLQITGTTSSSGEAFAGYGYSIKDDNLYLKIRYSIANPIHRIGDFNITIKGEADKVKKVYLQGNKSEDIKLIWTK